MARLSAWKQANAICALYLTMALAAQAQTFNTLFSFNGSDGNGPVADLAQGTDGSFYGVTAFGGPDNMGTLFRITPSGTLTTMGTDGNYYGTTTAGGGNKGGTVFKMASGGGLATLYRTLHRHKYR